jgi:outer membrane immunogenic protein
MTRSWCGRIASAVLALALGAPAWAADMPVKAPPAAPMAARLNWTGFYVGGHAGWAWTTKDWDISASGTPVADYTADGFMGGAQAGFNWQTGAWVLGAEVDVSWSQIRKGVAWTDPDPTPWTDPNPEPVKGGRVTTVRTGTTVENFGTIAGRLGHAFDRTLLYVKGGGAWVHETYRAFNANTADETLIASASGTRWGWMVGAGLEYSLLPNWSAKVEFDYLDFGTARITLVSIPGATPPTRDFDVRQSISVVKLGLNYRFGGM